MSQYITNSRYRSFFGMDVHARSISVRGFDRESGLTKRRRFTNCPTAYEIVSWISEHFVGPYYAAYESGCTGFYLCRELRELGVDCDVIAVSSIARSTDDRQRKTDNKDAKRLLAELLLPEPSYSVVHTPSLQDEGSRDLARAREDAVAATKRVKQQLGALLLRHGYVWNEKTPTGNLKSTWTQGHLEWIRRIDLGEHAANATLECYLQMVKECTRRVDEMSILVQEYAQTERFKPYVDAFCLLKGVDIQTAFLLAATIGDFMRFPNGRSVSKWLGVVPKEYSSGEHEYHGHITKAGDAHVRSALVEGTASIMLRTSNEKKAKKGHEVPHCIEDLCIQSNRRLSKRYSYLTRVRENHLQAPKAKIAIVNELIRWIWKIGCEVQEMQEKECANNSLAGRGMKVS